MGSTLANAYDGKSRPAGAVPAGSRWPKIAC